MNQIDPIKAQAVAEVEQEQFRAAVEREKARLRLAPSHRSLWQRLLSMLPFINRNTQ